jgi:hypothetical protein
MTDTAIISSSQTIPAQATETLTAHADKIRELRDCATKHLLSHVIAIGEYLVKAKKICPHGDWLLWLKREFDWSQSTADRFVQVYHQRDKLPTRGYFEFPLNGQYLLAAPSTPPEARQEIKERVESGERVSVAQVKETIAKTKAKQATVDETLDEKRITQSPEISAEERRAQNAALDVEPELTAPPDSAEEYTAEEVPLTPEEEAADEQSALCLTEFKKACRAYLPGMTESDRITALQFAHSTRSATAKKAEAA